MNVVCRELYKKMNQLYEEQTKINNKIDEISERYYSNPDTNLGVELINLEAELTDIWNKIQDCYSQIEYHSEGNIYGSNENWIMTPPVNTPLELYFRVRLNYGDIFKVCEESDEETHGAYIHRCIALICRKLKKYNMEPSFIKWQCFDFDFEWHMSDYVLIDSPDAVYDLINDFKTNIANCDIEGFYIDDIKVFIGKEESNKKCRFLKGFETFDKYDIESLHHMICYDNDDFPSIHYHLDKAEPTCRDYEGNLIAFEDVNLG